MQDSLGSDSSRTAWFVWIALVLGCSAGPASRAALEPPPQEDGELEELARPAWEAFRPIRFGDPLDPAYDAEFFPGAAYDASLPSPDLVLGQPTGSRPAHPHEIVRVFARLAEASPRMRLATYATSFEGRELVRAVITSPANHARLDEIKDALARLADPRGLDAAEAERLVRDTPACAWLGYSIHGDEISGSDASMALAHYLVGGTGPEVLALLDDLIIVIDPVMNPDGRERFLTQLEQTRGYVANQDYASMQRGRWPAGRGNHYLFDLNRDWIAGMAPETRGRWRAVREWNPQLLVDAHEMGALDTFLFYPQARAHNPHLAPSLAKWQGAFAADQGAAFDRHGWGFYTREWADAWAPFYSDAWGSLSGAIGILYEQASTDGQPVRRASGEVVHYRESVHKQVASSLANLVTLSANREAILGDFVASKRANLEVPEHWFVCRLGRNRDREDELLEILLGQGIEVFRGGGPEAAGANAIDALGRAHEAIDIPEQSLLVPARQPLAPLVLNYLGFDVRLSAEDLAAERAELERKDRSKIYDITAWSLPHALDLDAFWVEDLLGPAGGLDLERVTEAPLRTGAIVAPPESVLRPTAWAVDGTDDGAVVFAARALELGLAVHLADEPFTTSGRRFPRGSLLVRRHENDERELEARLADAAQRARVTVHATDRGRSPDEGPDLGGQHFQLLARPRIAVLANAPVHQDSLGHLWFALDHELGVPHTLLDAASFGDFDLRRYNVLVLPQATGALRAILEENAESLRTWVSAGGTLVACGNAAAMLADPELELSDVRLRRDVLEELAEYAVAVERERAARSISVVESAVWDGVSVDAAVDRAAASSEDAEGEHSDDEDEEDDEEPTAEEEAWMERFSPQGVLLRGEVDALTWLTAGVHTEEMPIYFTGSNVLLAKPPVTTAVRFAPAPDLRLSGLLWPEARERIADSAYLTREPLGNGQVILFAAMPGYRGYFKATGRLFANAVVYGPGAGAQQPIGW